MACEICSVSVNIFTRKKCMKCQRFHCAKCTKQHGTLTKVCLRCYRILTKTFTRKDLDHLTVKELRQFLIAHNHRIDQCRERTDLVEAAMKFSCVPHRSADDGEHSRHVEQLKERMREETSNSAHLATTSGGEEPDVSPTNSGESTVPLQLQADENIPSSQSSSSSGALHTQMDPSVTVDTAVTSNDSPPQVVPGSIENQPAVRMSPKTELAKPETPAHVRMTLSQLSKEEDIENLSARQLKELLFTNYVDFKGCCEKKELLDRVKRLWEDNKKNKGLASEDQIGTDVDLCKVCMDAVIDCILLECGHMVTCTQCGKRMAECPVCRHYVSRVVHVFKA